MRHRATPRFWRCYRALPRNIRHLADQSFTLLKSNPAHPSLHFKKVGDFWSARVGRHYRALAVAADEDVLWFWIGSHADYDRLVARGPASKASQPTSRAQRKGKSPKRSRASRG